MNFKAKIFSEDEVKRAIARISHQILEHNKGAEDTVLVGIRTRGVPLAKMIAQNLRRFENLDVPAGILDITLYRDDLSLKSEHPVINGSDIPFNIEGKNVILVDDVLFTGRTVRAAIDAIMDLGRPKTIQLAVLIDRGHRELPIRADYIGKNLPTSRNEIVSVKVAEIDGDTGVDLYTLL
ncbi:MAG: bifunctional pyr operon transcriptional regulator/uracil phosphoribosyltransferase PyrR [Clostridiales bacterium]|jgi:pyrimidine operon attenuation protein/uracil phosphoribosyltransferase|nr:bifunctional pyr operon transcriptional regulator/uracil phosphoribosyltransferase PyrR [Clostridiales bacterium]